MFTGLITDIGTVAAIDSNNGDQRFWIACNYDVSAIALGASIACDGCCLTVVEKKEQKLAFDVSNESLSKTTLGSWAEGTRVNLELSLQVGDELGGHIVSGHVDGVGTIADIRPEAGSHRVAIDVPAEFQKFIAPKGAITLNGVSLTVNEVNDNQLGVNIIPHTWEVTNLGLLEAGSKVNFEIDMLARYVARMLDKP